VGPKDSFDVLVKQKYPLKEEKVFVFLVNVADF
jgi:hypothetical protein